MTTVEPRRDHRNEQPAELISGVLTDARDYAVAEVDKLKAEAKEVGQEVKVVSIGALILTVAAIMLATALALALWQAGLPGWAGFGIIAIVFGGAGVLTIQRRPFAAKAAPKN